ncbi:MAG: hypothetical protein V4787_10955 [Pseudomonadota bacterium]
MALDAITLKFLWSLLQDGLIRNDRKRAIERISEFYNGEMDLPTKVDSLVIEYWSSGELSTLWALVSASVDGFYFETNKRTRLIALLFSIGEIDLGRALELLSFDRVIADGLDPSIRDIADAHWLWKESLAVGCSDPAQDKLLADALIKVAEETKAMANQHVRDE